MRTQPERPFPIPGVHISGDFGSACELVAVNIFNGDFIVHFFACVVAALDETVAVADNSGNCHAAEEAEVGIAELNRCITCHIAAEFFFINCAVYVLADVFLVVFVDETGSCAGFVMLIEAVEKVVFGNIESDELNILVLFLVLNLIKRSRKSKAGHNDDVVASVDGFFNFCNALFGGVACGFEVLEVNFVCITVFLAGFIGGLVERLVGDVCRSR